MTPARTKAQALTRHAAQDGAMGAAFGLLLACAYIGVDLRQMAASGAPMESLAVLIGCAIAQGAAIAGVGGAFLRRLVD